MKLEDLNKDNIFKVPERYFDTLPAKIQSRISGDEKIGTLSLFRWQKMLPYGIPVAVLIIIIFIVFRIDNKVLNPEELIAEVPSEILISYLNDSEEFSTEEMLSMINPSLVSDDLSDDIQLISDDLEMSETEIDMMLENYEIDDNILK